MKKNFIWLLLALLLATGGTFTPNLAAQAQVKPAAAAESQSDGEQIWSDLMEGNRRFVAGDRRSVETAALRQKLTGGQHPKVIVLACSDSRVAPELLFDQNLGDLFVIRIAGNIADPVGLGSIEYAVEHLGSSVLVVLGHEKCGAVTAACSGEKMPTPNLQAIVDKIAPAVAAAKAHSKPEDLVDAAIHENIEQSTRDLLAHSAVVREAMKDGKLTVIEAIYKLSTGEVVRLGKMAVQVPAYQLDVGDVMRMP